MKQTLKERCRHLKLYPSQIQWPPVLGVWLGHPRAEDGRESLCKINSFPNGNLGISQISGQTSVCGGPEWSKRGIPANIVAEKGNKITRAENREKGRTKNFLVCFKDLTTKLRFYGHVSIVWTGANKSISRLKF